MGSERDSGAGNMLFFPWCGMGARDTNSGVSLIRASFLFCLYSRDAWYIVCQVDTILVVFE